MPISSLSAYRSLEHLFFQRRIFSILSNLAVHFSALRTARCSLKMFGFFIKIHLCNHKEIDFLFLYVCNLYPLFTHRYKISSKVSTQYNRTVTPSIGGAKREKESPPLHHILFLLLIIILNTLFFSPSRQMSINRVFRKKCVCSQFTPTPPSLPPAMVTGRQPWLRRDVSHGYETMVTDIRWPQSPDVGHRYPWPVPGVYIYFHMWWSDEGYGPMDQPVDVYVSLSTQPIIYLSHGCMPISPVSHFSFLHFVE